MSKISSFLLYLLLVATAAQAQTVTKQWKLFSPATNAKFITWDWNNKMYIIDMNDELQESVRISGRGSFFSPVLPGKKIKDVNFAPNGNALALHLTDSLGWRRTNGKWEQTQGMLAMTVALKNGSGAMLYQDGTLVENGTTNKYGKFRYITSISNGNGLFWVKQDGSVNVTGSAPKSTHIAGDSTGVIGHIFVLGTDAAVYYFDMQQGKNIWTKIPSALNMKFIAMDRKGVLYGIGTDHRLWVLL